MPLPPELQARLLKRGLVKQTGKLKWDKLWLYFAPEQVLLSVHRLHIHPLSILYVWGMVTLFSHAGKAILFSLTIFARNDLHSMERYFQHIEKLVTCLLFDKDDFIGLSVKLKALSLYTHLTVAEILDYQKCLFIKYSELPDTPNYLTYGCPSIY